MTFDLTCVHIIFSSVRLQSGHLLGNSCLLGYEKFDEINGNAYKAMFRMFNDLRRTSVP